jgi:hypothetical protein
MTLRGRVENGVVVFTNGSPLREGSVVDIITLDQVAGPTLPAPGQKPPYPVSKEQKEALLALMGMCKTDNPPNDEEVQRIIEEYRMKKHG